MSSKSQILSAIRLKRPPAVDLPRLDGAWIAYDDRRRQFGEVLQSVGGGCVSLAAIGDLRQALSALPAYQTAQKIVSCVPEAAESTIELRDVTDPHQLEDVDFAILRGSFGVAENGAVWVTDEGLPHRVVYFIVQHLALVVPSGEIVDTMHQAYERLATAGFGRSPQFGAFISGPSKTADIEQSLVIGAHGARSLTVFLVDSL